MNRYMMVGFALASTLCWGVETTQPATGPSAIVDTFQQQLGAKLKGALNSSGATGAIAVCQEQAPRIAQQLGEQYGVAVRRVSSRPRNPAAAPDALDRQVLAEFAAALAKTHDDPLQQTVTSDTGKPRYYRAITTQAVCLTCHGETLNNAVSQALAEHYPNDTATGYKLGELRGAFVVE